MFKRIPQAIVGMRFLLSPPPATIIRRYRLKILNFSGNTPDIEGQPGNPA
jgi:hypothetical protein